MHQQVDLVVADREIARGLDPDLRVRVHPLMPAEDRSPVTRLEGIAVFRLPGAALFRLRRLAARGRVGRLPAAPLAALVRGYQRIARAFHGRAFMPAYRSIRPWLLSRRFRTRLRHLDCATVDRIVAADISAVPLGWKLARRYPGIVATTALDRLPYARLAPVDAAPG